MEYTKEDIRQNIDNWVCINLEKDFEFRQYQEESIVDIIYNILNNYCCHWRRQY